MAHHHEEHNQSIQAIPTSDNWTKWIPLGIIFCYIAGLTIIATRIGISTPYAALSYLMGFFFVIFSLFKMIDLPAFAMGYQEYDLIAKRVKAWGYAYPFIELVLGVLYLLVINSPILHIVTIVMSAIICLSVLIKLSKHEKFQCLCLGTVLKVPLTIVSLIEYAAMGIMAAIMLFGIVS